MATKLKSRHCFLYMLISFSCTLAPRLGGICFHQRRWGHGLRVKDPQDTHKIQPKKIERNWVGGLREEGLNGRGIGDRRQRCDLSEVSTNRKLY